MATFSYTPPKPPQSAPPPPYSGPDWPKFPFDPEPGPPDKGPVPPGALGDYSWGMHGEKDLFGLYNPNYKPPNWKDYLNYKPYPMPTWPTSPKPPGGGGGGGGGGGKSGTDAMLGALDDLFQPDKYPRSGSYSGLPKDARDLIAGQVPEMLIQSVRDYPGQVDAYETGAMGDLGLYTKLAARAYRNASQQALNQMMPGILNQLAQRNVLKSSAAPDTIAKAAGEVIPLYAQKGYEAAMQEASGRQTIRQTAFGARNQYPAILSAVTALSNYSESYTENPLAPYELLANFIMSY